MDTMSEVGSAIPGAVVRGEPMVWVNPGRAPAAAGLSGLSLTMADVEDAAGRWRRFAPLLARLFTDAAPAGGRIDSPLIGLSDVAQAMVLAGRPGRVLVKADHDLPVTGCIKARGGIYEVLVHAERLALAHGLLAGADDYGVLAQTPARDLFGRHTIAVGSTGNLGFSVGLVARALGFRAEVHMSHDAKQWKKERLRRLGVEVVEHASDYSAAVAAARASAAARADCYFVDDEDSLPLFLGYTVGALDLKAQLDAMGITVDAAHPLVVYLPCGVGGAPGGLTFGLKQLYGDAVTCVFVEPVRAPCMLVQLASGLDRSISVYEVGLDNRTAADGLAVSSASMLVAGLMKPLVDAIATVTDEELFAWTWRMWRDARLRLEPSAASGFAAVERTLAGEGLERARAASATHVVWTTGGSLLPEAEFEASLQRVMEVLGADHVP